MKMFKVDVDGVTVVEGEYEELLECWIPWDTRTFDDEHYIAVDYDGRLREKSTALVRNRTVPLPAFVFRAGHTDPLFDLEELRAKVDYHPVRDSLSLPAVGMDILCDEDGVAHTWRIALALPGRCRQAIRLKMPLPFGTKYERSTNHPVFGWLQDLPSTIEAETGEIIRLVREQGFDRVFMSDRHRGSQIVAMFETGGIAIEWMQLAPMKPNTLNDPFEIGFEAGHEIAHLALPDLRECAISHPEERNGARTVIYHTAN